MRLDSLAPAIRLDSLAAAIGSTTNTPADMDGYLARTVREQYACALNSLFNPAIEALAGAVRNDLGAHSASASDHGTSTHWRISRFGIYDALLIEVESLASFAAYLFVLDVPEH